MCPLRGGAAEARAASVAPSSLEVNLDGWIGWKDGWMMERNSSDCIRVSAEFYWWGLGGMFVSVCKTTGSVGMVLLGILRT